MRKIILTILATSLIAASTVQMADAAERHARHTHHDSFRGAYNQLSTPSVADTGKQLERRSEVFCLQATECPTHLKPVLLSDALACTPPPSQQTIC